MARSVSEEFVTRKILKWLIENNFQVICFDFPQSGTGRLIGHAKGEKNKGATLPDIVAVKKSICVVFENKNRLHKGDLEKVRLLKSDPMNQSYFRTLIKGRMPKTFLYGIGLFLSEMEISKLDPISYGVDFIVVVDLKGCVEIIFDPSSCFS